MAIIKVNRIKNITALDRYLLSHEAHEKTDLVRVRNFTVFGHNVMKTYDHKFDAMYLASQQWAVRKVANKRKKKTQGFHMIVSFSDEDFPDVKTKDDLKKQVIQARSLLKCFLDEELPDESQWYAVLQKDGDGHKLHAHVAINSVQLDGRTLDTNILSLNKKLERVKQKKKEQEEAKEAEKTKDKKKKPKYVAKAGLYERFQNYFAKHFEKETGRKYKKIMRNEETMHTGKEGAYLHRVHKRFEKATSWREDIASSIKLILPRAKSLDDFKQLMYRTGRIRVDERNASYIDADGKKQTRLAYTYCTLDKDDKVTHKVRDFRVLRNGSVRGLGKSTTPQAIQLVIDRNIQLRMAQQEEERREKNREAIARADKLKQQKKREKEKAKREKQMNEILLANKRKEQQKRREQEQAEQRRLQEERQKRQEINHNNDQDLGF